MKHEKGLSRVLPKRHHTAEIQLKLAMRPTRKVGESQIPVESEPNKILF